MKKIIILLLCLNVFKQSNSQWLTQSAEGKGTVLSKGANVSVDIGKTDIDFSINNLNKPVNLRNSKPFREFIFGGSLSGKNEEGIGNLFSRGDFVPSSKLTGFLGIRLIGNDSGFADLERELRLKLDALSENQVFDFWEKMATQINNVVDGNLQLDDELADPLKSTWLKELKKSNAFTFRKYLKAFQKNNPPLATNLDIANIIAQLATDIQDIVKEYEKARLELTKELAHFNDGYVKSNQSRLAVFTFGGINASSFKRVESIVIDNLPASFIKEEFRGGHWGAGLNYQTNRVKIGLTYAYRMTNNFDLLDKTDYTLTDTYTSGGTELKKTKPVTAYSGKYGTVEINEFNLDVLVTVGLGKSSETYALLNGYLRSNMFSRNKELLPNSFNIGAASYFFTRKSKFLGGLYVELPDVDDNYERSKPVDDQNIRPALRRLTFGIVGKFSINSLISWQ